MRTKTIALSLLTALLLLPTTGSAQNRKKDFMKKKMAEMGITEEQGAKLKELHQEMRSFRKEHMAKVKEVREKTKQELLKDNPSRSALSTYSEEMGNLHKKMNDNRIDHLLKMKAVLTPEQFEKIADHGCKDKKRYMRHGKMKGQGGCMKKGGVKPCMGDDSGLAE